jgi:hypothetical protein
VLAGGKRGSQNNTRFSCRPFKGHSEPKIHQQTRAENQHQVQGTAPSFLVGPNRYVLFACARWATMPAWKSRSALRLFANDNLHQHENLYRHENLHHRRRQAQQRQERDDAAFSLPFIHARLLDGDEYPAGALAAGRGGRVGAVAPHVLILVVMGAFGRPSPPGNIPRLIRSHGVNTSSRGDCRVQKSLGCWRLVVKPVR